MSAGGAVSYRALFRTAVRSLRRWQKIFRRVPRLMVKFPGDEELFMSLSKRNPELRKITTDRRGLGINTAKDRLVRHFRTRNLPRFFIQPEAMAAAVTTIAVHHPGWREQLLNDSRDWCVSLGDAYMTKLGSKGTIDWQNLPAGPGRDHLYQDRVHLFAFAAILARAMLFGAPVGGDLRRNIASWMQLTEAQYDPAGYSGGLIVVYRAVAITWTLAFLAGGSEDVELEFMLLRIMLSDARFLADRLGSSFPNNHLLADGFCLWYLGSLFPEFKESEAWKVRGEAVWLAELRRQIHADGASFEQSSHYQMLACEMALGYVLINHRNDRPIPDWVNERVERMLRFHADLYGTEGCPMTFGDCVEDPLFPLGCLRAWGHGDYRTVYASLFHPSIPQSDQSSPDNETAFWLLGGTLPVAASTHEESPFAAYSQGGCFVFRDLDANSRLMLRTGPARDAAVNPGHMHADLLSITLQVGDQAVIVEAGTYTYRSAPRNWPMQAPPWREYFMSPFAHNGLAIEGVDPLQRGPGDFPGIPIQSRVRTVCEKSGSALTHVAAEIIGATSYSGHRRGVVAVSGQYWLVYDLLPRGAPLASLSFGLQCAIGSRITHESNSKTLWVDAGSARLGIAMSDGIVIERIVRGGTDPVSGWVSRRYGEIHEAPMLRYKMTDISGFHATLLSPSAVRPLPKPEALELPAGDCAFRISDAHNVDYLMLSSEGNDKVLSMSGIDFVGGALWLRTTGGMLAELRWLEGRGVTWPAHGLRVTAQRLVEELRIDVTATGIQVTGCPHDQVSVIWENDAVC